MSTPTASYNSDGSRDYTGRVLLFGYDPADARATVYERDAFWRGSRALAFVGVGLLIAPVAALLPPHAPWAIGALMVGGLMGRRKWSEHRTLVQLEAACPRCERALRCAKPTRMREPHSVTCEGCHYEMELRLETPAE